MANWFLRFCVLLLLLSSLLTTAAQSQGPLEQLRGGGTLSRLPNDQIEGTIWEYKATLTDGEKKEVEGELVNKLTGRFRTEDGAVMDVSRRLSLPSSRKIKSVVESFRSGNPGEVAVPSGPQQKRLGNYRRVSKSKMRFDFDDEKSLFGTMTLRPKKGTRDVWQGTYQEKQDKRTIRKWKVEIRPIED